MARVLFSLACRNNGGSEPMVIRAVEAIRKHHPEADIVVVDSDSPDKSYFEKIKPFNVIIEDVANCNYDTGAIWHVYQHLPKYDHYFFVHDSLIIKKPLFEFMESDVACFRYFKSHDGFMSKEIIKDRRTVFYQHLKKKLFKCKYEREMIFGFDNEDQREWINSLFKKHTPYYIPKFFVSLFGPMIICKRSALDQLCQNGFHNLLPANKNQQTAMERAWGIAFMMEKYDFASHAVQGDNFQVPFDYNGVEKVILNRK